MLQGTNVSMDALGLMEKRMGKITYSLDHEEGVKHVFNLPTGGEAGPSGSQSGLIPIEDTQVQVEDKDGVTEAAPFMPPEDVFNYYMV